MIDIQKAENIITKIDATLRALSGEINVEGKYLLFERLEINEISIADVSYVFNAFVAIRSAKNNKKLQYKPLSQLLHKFIQDYQNTQRVNLGQAAPFAVKGFIVYKIPLIVNTYRTDNQVT